MKRTAYIVFTISLSLLFGNCATAKAETAQIVFRGNSSVGDNQN